MYRVSEREREKNTSDLCRRSDVWSERVAFEFEQKTAKLSKTRAKESEPGGDNYL